MAADRTSYVYGGPCLLVIAGLILAAVGQFAFHQPVVTALGLAAVVSGIVRFAILIRHVTLESETKALLDAMQRATTRERSIP